MAHAGREPGKLLPSLMLSYAPCPVASYAGSQLEQNGKRDLHDGT